MSTHSVKELKKLLSDGGVDSSNCIEKSELVALAVKHKLIKTDEHPKPGLWITIKIDNLILNH